MQFTTGWGLGGCMRSGVASLDLDESRSGAWLQILSPFAL